ncbi:flagellin [Rhizobium sp. BIGb0125]|jgi:flagellin|nr:flagellin [Rhizobium sp. BIGb0125]
MTSILTNAGATSALQTLRTIGSNLNRTQNQVSSGLRVQTAADNAAYWSISTTMRSDTMAIDAVTDALNLGAAKVDTAYEGLESTVDILKQFKAKLVTAKEDSVDRTKVQEELAQLIDQAKSVSESASFSGQNWLNTDFDDIFDKAQSMDSVVSSFVRNSNGGVSVKTTDVDVSKLTLFNTTGDGLLQVDSRAIGDIGGLRDVDWESYEMSGWQYFNFPHSATFGAADVITFDYTADGSALGAGTTYTLTIDRSTVNDALGAGANGYIGTVRDWMVVISRATWSSPPPSDPSRGSGFGQAHNIGGVMQTYGFFSGEMEGLPGSSVRMSNVTSTLAGGYAFGLNAPTGVTDGEYADFGFNFGDSFQMKTDVEFYFDLSLNRGTPQMIKVTKDDVDTALGITTGEVNNAADMATVLQHVLTGKGISSVTSSGSRITLDIDQSMYPDMGYRSSIKISGVWDNIGNPPDVNLVDMDITTPSVDLDRYIRVIEGMTKKVVSAASLLGSIQTRIDLQLDFASKLGDSIDSGIGRLVDADMNEASTRLKAQQTQQQLAVQALSISNSNSESLLSLFR